MAQGRVEKFQPAVLRRLMAAKHMNPPRLAMELGLTPSAVRRWANGTSGPSTEHAGKIAEFFKVDVLELLGKTMDTADIVDIRHRAGLSAAETSRRLGVSRGAIYHVEAGVEIPSRTMLDNLAELYGQKRSFIRLAWIRRRRDLHGLQSVQKLPDYLDREVPDEWKDTLEQLEESEVREYADGRIMAYLDAGKIGLAYEIWTPEEAETLIEYTKEALETPASEHPSHVWQLKGLVMEYFPDEAEPLLHINDQAFTRDEVVQLQAEMRAAITAIREHSPQSGSDSQ